VVFEQELDALKLGIHKAQAVFQPPLEQQQLQWLSEQLDTIKLETRGSMVSLVARRDQETVEQVLAQLNPVFSETLPLSLEEVFISEMEAAGYDLDKILS
jgi:ABC-2 type transport system ATP-binding protein